MSLEQIYTKLEKIRAFDSLIDFSKSRIQLDIVLHLAAAQKPLPADEIAKALNIRKKPVLDALRKLELKGIVRRTSETENIYELSDLGKQMIEDLMAILGFNDFQEIVRKSRRYGKIEARDLIKLIIPVHYLYETLVALGTAKNNELSLTALAKVNGISPQRLSIYLDPYADTKSEIRLFKKTRKETILTRVKSILFKSRRSEVHYRLTSIGLESFYRLPIYTKVKNNRFAHIVIKIFGTYSPKLVLYRLATIHSISMATLTALIVLGLAVPVIVLPLAALNLLLALLVLFAYS